MITFTRCAFMAKQACATFSQVVQKITPPSANNFLKFFFALFAILTLNAATAWAAEYILVTNIGNLSNGDKVIIATKTNNKPSSGVTGGIVQASTSTKKDATVSSTEADWMQFTVTTTSNGWYLSNSSSQFVGKPTENTFYLTTTSNCKGVCSVNANGVLCCNSRYLQKNGNYYRMYSGINNSYTPFYVWKVATSYTVNWTVNPATGGALSATTGNSTTVTPNAAYTYGNPAYTIKTGKASVNQSENTFTATPTANCTIQINMVQKTTADITFENMGSPAPATTGYYVGDTYTLPSENDFTCGDKTFVGWSTDKIVNLVNKPTINFYEPGASVTLQADNIFYAVFAETGGLSDENEVLLNFTGGTKNDLTNTEGITASGLGSDYAESHAPYRVKLDTDGDYILYTNESKPYISQVFFKVKMIGGANTSTITIGTSENGSNYTQKSICTISGKSGDVLSFMEDINTSAKYLRLYFNKGSNVGLGQLVVYTKSSVYQNYTTECGLATKTHTITFNSDGGSAVESQTIEEGNTATEPKEPDKTGYTFSGWYTEPECTTAFDFATPITSDIILYAKWVAITYKITLDANGGVFTSGGNTSETIVVDYVYGSVANYEDAKSISTYLSENNITLTRSGFVLKEKWQSGGVPWTKIFTSTGDRTITAQWTPVYTITWKVKGEKYTTTEAVDGVIELPTTPADQILGDCGANKFMGWSENNLGSIGQDDAPNDLFTEAPTDPVSENKTFYAVFATREETDGGTIDATLSFASKAQRTSWSTSQQVWTQNGITLTNVKANSTSDVADYADPARFYKDSKITITASGNISKIVFNCSEDKYATALKNSIKNDAVTINGTTVDVTLSGTSSSYTITLSSGQVRLNSLTVTTDGGKIIEYSDYITACSYTLVEITEGDNTEVLNNYTGQPISVEVTRQFTHGNLYTISLPFTLENVSSVFGNQAYEYTSLAKDGNDVVLYFNKVNTIEAGKPYLIEPTKDVHGFSVDNVTLSNATNNISFSVGTTTVDMEAVLSAGESDMTGGKYWLAADRYLYNNKTRLLGLRAVFNINSASGIAPRARVAFRENTTTGLSNITNDENTTIKVIENGQLIIIRNGEKFNAQGIKF